jgi:hypothetical protein
MAMLSVAGLYKCVPPADFIKRHQSLTVMSEIVDDPLKCGANPGYDSTAGWCQVDTVNECR